MTRVAPVLPVRDVAAALAHYAALGFVARPYEETSAGAHFYGFVSRDGVELHLSRFAELDPHTNTSACYLYVDDADALRATWEGLPGRLTAAEDTPYGLREFAHIDPDGNLLRVGSPLASPTKPG